MNSSLLPNQKILIFGTPDSGAELLAEELQNRFSPLLPSSSKQKKKQQNDENAAIDDISSLPFFDPAQKERNNQEERERQNRLVSSTNSSSSILISMFSNPSPSSLNFDDEESVTRLSSFVSPFFFSQQRYQELITVMSSKESKPDFTIITVDFYSWLLFAVEGGFFSQEAVAAATSTTTLMTHQQTQQTQQTHQKEEEEQELIQEILMSSFSSLCGCASSMFTSPSSTRSPNTKFIIVLTKFNELCQSVDESLFGVNNRSNNDDESDDEEKHQNTRQTKNNNNEKKTKKNKNKKKNRKNYDFFTLLAEFVVNHMDVVIEKIVLRSLPNAKVIIIDFENHHQYHHNNQQQLLVSQDDDDDETIPLMTFINLNILTDEIEQSISSSNGSSKNDGNAENSILCAEGKGRESPLKNETSTTTATTTMPTNQYKPPLMAKIKGFFTSSSHISSRSGGK